SPFLEQEDEGRQHIDGEGERRPHDLPRTQDGTPEQHREKRQREHETTPLSLDDRRELRPHRNSFPRVPIGAATVAHAPLAPVKPPRSGIYASYFAATRRTSSGRRAPARSASSRAWTSSSRAFSAWRWRSQRLA